MTLRGIKVPLREGGSLLLGLDTHHHAHFMTQLHYTLAIYLFIATLLSGLLGWWAARRGLAPLRVMRERARNIDARQLNIRMPTADSSAELVELAQGLNLMLERLEQDFERISEFSSDLAHELRTPITNLLTQTQVTLTRERDAESYRDILASNAEEFQRLARMVSDMLYLAKTEHGLELPNREPLSLAVEVQALFDFYECVSEEARIGLSLQGDATIVGDRLMVRRAIGNLLSNALRHAFKHSVIEVIVTRLPDAVELTVKNEGHPIDEAVIPRLFDRFYRTQKSRPHPEHSGTGLGLSITRSLMLAQGGSITVASNEKNTSFTLVFLKAS
jgi:two-component system heavy metal sensor histidine kinase CusS